MSFSNRHNLPAALVRAIVNDPYSGVTDLAQRKVSVTRLIAPPQMVHLQAQHPDIEEDVAERLWSLLGSSVHAMIERATPKVDPLTCPVVEGDRGGPHGPVPWALSEERLEATFRGWTITGALDLLEVGELSDWKVTSAYTIVYGSRFREWEQQQNLYAWLADQNGHEVRSVAVMAILRDFDSKEAGKGRYPTLPFCRVPLRLWSTEEVETFLADRIAALETLPVRPCTPEETWGRAGAWKVMRPGGTCAKKFADDQPDAMQQAYETAEAIGGAAKGMTVTHEPGKAVRCESYCPVRTVCPQRAGQHA